MDLIAELETRFPGITQDALDRIFNAQSIIDPKYQPKFGWSKERACAVLLIIASWAHQHHFEARFFAGELRLLKRRRFILRQTTQDD